MPRATTAKRHEKLIARYHKMAAKKNAKGASVYTTEYIVSELSDEFFYTEKTILQLLKGSKTQKK